MGDNLLEPENQIARLHQVGIFARSRWHQHVHLCGAVDRESDLAFGHLCELVCEAILVASYVTLAQGICLRLFSLRFELHSAYLHGRALTDNPSRLENPFLVNQSVQILRVRLPSLLLEETLDTSRE